MTPYDTKNPKVTIGLAVYNGEKFIRKRLDNILSQTFNDFELIISDDSTDSTPEICQEYAKRDKRIRYIHQKKNMGWIWNFLYVLREAKGKYYTHTGVDDWFSEDFLEKNAEFLDTQQNFVTSTGKAEYYGPKVNQFDPQDGDSFFTDIYKQIRRIFRPPLIISDKSGTYEKRAGFCLRHNAYGHTLGLTRIEKLRLSSTSYDNPFFVCDWANCLDLLRHGKVHVFDKIMIRIYNSGFSTKGIFNQWKKQKTRLNEYFLPYSTFTMWCIGNIGLKFFFMNLDYFIWLNLLGILGILVDIGRISRRKISSKNYST